jgi:hypothetical protein
MREFESQTLFEWTRSNLIYKYDMSEIDFSLYMYTLDMKEQIPQSVCGRKKKIRNCE